MARRKSIDDEIRKNSGSVGYSQKALDALMAGQYDQLTGRDSKYHTSSEQLKAIPVLDGVLSNNNQWESSFGRNKPLDFDTGRARQKYEQRINYAPIGKSLTQKDADLIFNGALGMLNNNMSAVDAANAMRTQGITQNYVKNKNWEKEYGKSLETLIEEFANNESALSRKSSEIGERGNKISKTIGGMGINAYVKPAMAARTLSRNLIAPDSQNTKNVNKASKIMSTVANSAKESTVRNAPSLVKGLYDFSTMAGERGLRNVLPGGDILNGLATAEDTRQALEDRGVTGRKASAYALARGGLDYAITKIASNLSPIQGGNVFTRAGKSFVREGGLGLGEQTAAEIADKLLLGNEGSFETDVKTYVARGLSEEEASKRAWDNLIMRVGGTGAVRGLVGAGGSVGRDISKAVSDKLKDLAYRAYIDRYVVDPDDPIFNENIIDIDDLNEYFYSENTLPGGDLPRLTGTADAPQALPGGQLPALPDNIYPIQMPGTNGVINLPGETAPIALPDLAAKSAPVRTMNERASSNPKVVARIEEAISKKSSLEGKIKAIENNISIYEQDTWRGQIKKSAKAKIRSANKEIKEIKHQIKALDREINGEPTPMIERLDKTEATSYRNYKKSLKEIGQKFGGDEGTQIAKSAIDNLDNWLNTGNMQAYSDFGRDVFALHALAQGNVEYDYNYGGEDGIFGATFLNPSSIHGVIEKVMQVHKNAPAEVSAPTEAPAVATTSAPEMPRLKSEIEIDQDRSNKLIGQKSGSIDLSNGQRIEKYTMKEMKNYILKPYMEDGIPEGEQIDILYKDGSEAVYSSGDDTSRMKLSNIESIVWRNDSSDAFAGTNVSIYPDSDNAADLYWRVATGDNGEYMRQNNVEPMREASVPSVEESYDPALDPEMQENYLNPMIEEWNKEAQDYLNENTLLTDNDVNDYLRAGKSFHKNRHEAYKNGTQIVANTPEELKSAIQGIIDTPEDILEYLPDMQPIGVMRVSESIANALNAKDNEVNARDYFFQLEPQDVWHTFKGHTEPKEADDLPMDIDDMVYAITHLNDGRVVNVIKERSGRKIAQLIIPESDTNEYYTAQVISKKDGALSLKTLAKIKKGSMDSIGDSQSPNAIRSHTTSNNNITADVENVNDEAAGYWRRVLGDSEFALQEAEKQGVDVDTLRQAAANNMGYELPADSVTPPPSNVPPTPENNGDDNMRERGMSRHMRGEGAMEMEGVPDEVKEDFINNPDMYKVLSNKSTQEKADYIYNNAEDVEAAFRELLIKKDPAALPLGHQIAKDYSAAGNYDMAAQIYRDMGEKLTEAGQFSQAAVLAMMREDPMTALHYAKKELSKLNAEGKKRFGDKWKPFELTEDEIDAFNHINPGDTEAIQEMYNEIGQRIGREYPTTFMEKLLEGRKIAMLFNPRTVSRNFLANPPTLAMRWVSDRIEALGQEIVSLIDPSFEKTQAITGSGIKGRRLAKEFLESEAGQRLLNGTTGKYEVPDIKGAFTKDKQMYKGTAVSKWIDRVTNGGIQRLNESLFDKKGVKSVAETIRNVTYGLLELGDNPFVKENFVERLGSYIHAKGIKNVEDIPEEAVMLAWEEAMKATYKDDSWAVNMLNKMKKSMESVPVVGRPLSQATIPFVQAPGNISARMVDYSAIRGTKGIADVISGAKNGDASKVRRGIEEISKGLTGVLGIAAGMALYKSGIITGDVAENIKEKAFQQMDGYKAWALHVGNKYFKYDWAQPGAEQLIIGTLLQQAIDNSDEYDSDILRYFGIEGSKAGKVAGALGHGIKSSVNSWFDQSSLQGLMDLMKGNSGQSTDMAQNIVDVGVSDFAGALVPAVGNATAKTLDTTARQTTDPSNTFATFLNQQMAKIPEVSKNLPAKYDVWGEEVKYAKNKGEAFLQRFVVPGEYGTESSDPTNKEIRRLFDATSDEKAFPFYAAKKVGDKQLNNKEVSEYQKDMGQRSKKMVEKLFDSKRYKEMSDDERVTALYNLYQTSKVITERDVFGKAVPDNSQWKKYVNAYDEAGGGEKGINAVVNFSEAKSAMTSAGITASSNLGKQVEAAANAGDKKKVEEITNAAQSVEDLGFTKVGPKETYIKAKEYDSSLSLEDFGKTYRDIDANGNQGITQNEVLDYLSSNHVPQVEGMKIWNMYAPNGKMIPYVKEDGTWGKKKAK